VQKEKAEEEDDDFGDFDVVPDPVEKEAKKEEDVLQEK